MLNYFLHTKNTKTMYFSIVSMLFTCGVLLFFLLCGTKDVNAQIPVRDYTVLGDAAYYNFDCKSAGATQATVANGTAAWYANFENWCNTNLGGVGGTSAVTPGGRGIPPGWTFSSGIHCYGAEGEFLRAEMGTSGGNADTKYIIMPALPATTNWASLRMRLTLNFTSSSSTGFDVFVTDGSDLTNITLLGTVAYASHNNYIYSPDRGSTKYEGSVHTFDIGTAYVNANATALRIGFKPHNNVRVDLYQVELYYEGVTGTTASNIGPYAADVTWNAFPGTSNYTIEWGPQGYTPGSAAALGTATSTMNSYSISGLASSQLYTVAVKSDADLAGCWKTANFQTSILCAAPTALSASNQTTSTIDVAWTGAANSVGYNVMWGTAGFNPANGSSDPHYVGTDYTTNNTYQITGLNDATAYVAAIQCDCGSADGNSTWATVTSGTIANETYGNGFWKGYVYSAPTARTITSTYLGYVEENSIFSCNLTPWGSATRPASAVWIGTAPSDYFGVRYKMQYTLPCGKWTFTVGNDDYVRLSVDGGLTWLPFTNTAQQDANGWSTANGNFTTSTPIIADGNTTYDFVFEFTEGNGGNQASFTMNQVLVSITNNVSAITSTSCNVSFDGTALVNYFVSDILEADPNNPTGNIYASGNNYDPTMGAINVTGLTPEATYYVYAQISCGGAWANISVTLPSTCPQPTNFVGVYQNPNVIFTWDALGQNTWDIVVSNTALTDPATEGTIVNLTANTYTIANYVHGTQYYVYLRSSCGSNWANFSFNWSYCTPTTGGTSYYISSVVSTGAIQNINHTGLTAGAYFNNTDMVISQFAGTPTQVALTTNSSTHTFRGYIDWNGDLDFNDANETVFSQNSYVSSYTGTINIPEGTPPGNYRFRVSSNYYSTNTACSVNGHGSFHDYTFQVLPVMPCMLPTNVVVSNITTDGATISWTASSSNPSDGYEIYYSTNATAPDENTIPQLTVASGITTVSLSGLLNEATHYYVWVRGNCGLTDGVSLWIGANFITSVNETYGVGIWNGYVYTSPTMCTFVNYLGMIHEPAQFTHANTSGAWTSTQGSAQETWVGSAPLDNFSVRYKMIYDFPCGDYNFTLPNIDDQARLSLDGGNTWILSSSNYGSANNNGTVTTSTPIHLSGATNMVLEFYEAGGGAAIGCTWANATTPITVTAGTPTTNSVDITFAGGTGSVNWDVLVCLTPQTDLTNPTNVVQPQVNTSNNPHTISGLTGATTYYIYAREGGCGPWALATVTTLSACATPTGLAVSNVNTTTADITWDADVAATDGWIVEWGTQGFTPGVGQEIATQIVAANTYTISSGITANNNYSVAVRANCGTTDGYSAWTTVANFTTPVCNIEDQCTFTLVCNDSYGDGWNGYSETGSLEVFQNGVSLGSYVCTGSSNSYPITICDGANITIVYTGNNYYGEHSYQLKDAENNVVASQGTSMSAGTVGNITAACPLSDDTEILTVTLNGEDGVINGTDITFNLPCGTNVTALTPAFTLAAGASIAPVTAQNFTNPVTYTVTAENGTTTATYTVTVNTAITVTPCVNITTTSPYSEGFEAIEGVNYNLTGGSVPSCWYTTSTGGNSIVPHVTGGGSYHYPHTGSKALTFTAGSATTYGNNSYAVMPAFDKPIQNLLLSFWERQESASIGELSVGYITCEQTDLSTFTPLVTIPKTTTITQRVISMAAAPSNATYIVFRWNYSSSFYSCGIDDINVQYINCGFPENITASNVKANTATISWTDPTVYATPSEGYQIYYSDTQGEPSNNDPSIQDLTSNTINLSNLTSNTLYYVYIRGNCGNDDYSPWMPLTFTTTCDEIMQLPFTENFDSWLSGSTAPFISCWYKLNTYSATTSYPYIATTSVSTPNALYFTASTTTYTAAITPPFGMPLQNLLVEFDARFSTATANIDILCMENPADIASAVEVVPNIATTAGNNTYAHYGPYPLGSYTGNGSFIAFRCNTGGTIYMDNLIIREKYSNNDILTFSLPEQTEDAVIDPVNHTVNIDVVFGTNPTALTPTITVSPYATISPLSGVAVDFTSPVTYTVTAEDGTPQIWTVTVNVLTSYSSAKEIITFTVPGQVGNSVIDNTAHTVAISMPWNSASSILTSLTPTITTSPFSTIAPLSGAVQDFTAPVIYTVTAQDGTTQDYTVSVIIAPVPAGAQCSNPIPYNINSGEVTHLVDPISRQLWFAVTLDKDYSNVIFSTCGTLVDNKLFIVANDCSQNPTQSSNSATADWIYFNDDAPGTFCSVDLNQAAIFVGNTAVYPSGTYTGNLTAGTYYVVLTPYSSGTSIVSPFALEVTGTHHVLAQVDVDNAVQNSSYCAGTSTTEADVLATLPQTITIADVANETVTLPVTWTLPGFDPTTPAVYTATSTITLPYAWSQPATPLALDLTSQITIHANPIITVNNTVSCGSYTLPTSNTDTWVWTNSNQQPVTAATTTGTYYLTATNAAGCISSTHIDVVVNSIPTMQITVNPTVCVGDEVAVDFTGTAPYTVAYTVNGMNPAVAGLPTTFATNNETIEVVVPGTYNFAFTQLTDANNCAIVLTDNFTVMVNPTPATPMLTSTSAAICAGETATLQTVTNGTWYFNGNAITSNIVNVAGTYKVVIVENGCASDTANFTLVVNAIPAVPVVTPNAMAICAGETTTLPSITNGSWTFNGSSLTTNTISVAGIYDVTVTENGCTSSAAHFTLTVNALPPTPAVSDIATCETTITLPAILNGVWYDANHVAVVGNITETGVYTIIVTNADNCSKDTAITVIFNEIPVINITQSGLVLTAEVAGNNLTYLWNTGETTPSITISTAGTYTVTVTTSEGCESTASVEATVGIEDAMLTNGVKLYPNPATDEVNIMTTVPFETIEVINAIGQSVYKTTLTQNAITLDVTQYSAGIYYVKLQGDNGMVTKKFVKK